MKKLLITLLKVGISVGIIAYLVNDAAQDNAFKDLRDQPKHWGFLLAALGVCAAAVLVTLVRWCYLVRALEMPFRVWDALRIGLLGYLLNLAPMGIVGGDLLKAVMLARERPGNRAKAVASVAADRLVGLYVLFVVASVAILLTGFWRLPVPEIRFICQVTWILTAVGAVGIVVVLMPALTDGRISQALGGLPHVGPTIGSLLDAVRLYRSKPRVILLAATMSICVHSLFAIGAYLIARGLPGFVPTIGTFFVIMPLSAVTGILPLPMGPFELVFEFLYTRLPLPAGCVISKGQGLIIALAYRVITVLIAAVGFLYYLGARREVAELMQEAKQEQEYI